MRDALGVEDEPASRLGVHPERLAHTGRALGELTAELRREGVGLVVARMRPYVEERLSAAGVTESVGSDRFFPTGRAAVAYCLEQPDDDQATD